MPPSSDPVIVDLPGRAYAIHIRAGLLGEAGSLLRSRTEARRVDIVTDTIVGPLYSEKLASSLEAAKFEVTILTVPAGESSKSLAIAAELYDALAGIHHARDEPIISLGGGMVGDLAGFVAATWHRGVPFVQCPTTLESDIDAAVGGKSAINHAAGKNLIGAFHQPFAVLTDVDCLATLGDRDFRGGLAESVKHAVIADAAFLAWHEANTTAIARRDPAALCDLIRRNCEIKAGVVVADERETGAKGVGRAALNFGHTIGHAIESAAGGALRHGEAVAIGMAAEMELAVRICGFPEAARKRVEALLGALGPPTRCDRPIGTADILRRIRADKKVSGGRVRFALPNAIGSVVWAAPDDADIIRCFEHVRSA